MEITARGKKWAEARSCSLCGHSPVSLKGEDRARPYPAWFLRDWREGMDGEGRTKLEGCTQTHGCESGSVSVGQWSTSTPQEACQNSHLCSSCLIPLASEPASGPRGADPRTGLRLSRKIQEGKGAAQLRWASFKDRGLSPRLCSVLCFPQSLGLNPLPGFDARVDLILPFCPLD